MIFWPSIQNTFCRSFINTALYLPNPILEDLATHGMERTNSWAMRTCQPRVLIDRNFNYFLTERETTMTSNVDGVISFRFWSYYTVAAEPANVDRKLITYIIFPLGNQIEIHELNLLLDDFHDNKCSYSKIYSSLDYMSWQREKKEKKCKGKVFYMARSLPVDNLLPQTVGSIINYLQ